MLFEGDFVGKIKKSLNFWSIESAGNHIRRKIERTILVTNLLVLTTLTLSICSGILIFENLSNDRQMYFILNFLDQYFPNCSNFLARVYKSTFPFLTYVSVAHAFQIVYFTQHAKFQLQILQEYLRNISNVSLDVEEEKLFYNLEYQKE